jgi:hypothetical protein
VTVLVGEPLTAYAPTVIIFRSLFFEPVLWRSAVPKKPKNTPDDCLVAFLGAMNEETQKTSKSLTDVMANFRTDSRVGITSYGPQFIGYSEVQKLFRQLFFAFPDLTFNEQQGNTRLRSQDSMMIGTQVNLAGTHEGVWFAKGTPYFSPPLSTITPDATRMMNLDACAVFTFKTAIDVDVTVYYIYQLAIYFDRYLMSQQLAAVSSS